MPARLDLTVRNGRAMYRGDHRTIDFQSFEDGVAKNISGATWLGQVRAEPGGTVLLTLTIATTDAATGRWRWTWTPTDSETLLAAGATEPQTYYYDIQRTLGGVTTTVIRRSLLEVDPDISRAP
jgi:hypothetical protein